MIHRKVLRVNPKDSHHKVNFFLFIVSTGDDRCYLNNIVLIISQYLNKPFHDKNNKLRMEKLH